MIIFSLTHGSVPMLEVIVFEMHPGMMIIHILKVHFHMEALPFWCTWESTKDMERYLESDLQSIYGDPTWPQRSSLFSFFFLQRICANSRGTPTEECITHCIPNRAKINYHKMHSFIQ